MLDAVQEVTIRGYITRKMNSSPRLLNSSVFQHLLNTPIGINLLQYLSRGLSNLELLLSSQPYKTRSFSHLSSWLPHRLESEDHAIPWFCPKPSFLIQVVGFPIGLSPRTMQCLGSKTQFSHPGSWFPHRLESEDYAMPWFCPKPSFLLALELGFKGVSSSAKPLEPSKRLTLANVAPSQESQPLAELYTRTL